MPVGSLNNAATQDSYTDALTVQFPFARGGFSVQVYNAAVMYKVGIIGPSGRDIQWEPGEHFYAPALLTFRDPAAEGFPQGSLFAGIMLRSAAAATPARVTVA